MQTENNITKYHIKSLKVIGQSNNSQILKISHNNIQLALKVITHTSEQCLKQCSQLLKEFKISQELQGNLHIVKQLSFYSNKCQKIAFAYIDSNKQQQTIEIEGVQGCSLLMEYANQGDLIDVVNQNMKITYDLQFIKKVFKPVCKGLQTLHKQGYAHNDIKLENIFVFDNYNCKLGDFGFSNKSYRSKKTQFEEFKNRNLDLLPPEMTDFIFTTFKQQQIQLKQQQLIKQTDIEQQIKSSSVSTNNSTDSEESEFYEELNNNEEMIDEKKCDIYSLGLSLFQSFVKIYPINEKVKNRQNDTVYHTFCQKKYKTFWSQFPNKFAYFQKYGCQKYNNKQILESFFDLMQGMVQPDPKLRFTIEQVINHEFFTQN